MCVKSFESCFFVISLLTVSRHSTSKRTWSECMDFRDAQIYVISDLGGLKRFFNQGLNLKIEEEKVHKRGLGSNVHLKAENLRTHILAFNYLGPVMA